MRNLNFYEWLLIIYFAIVLLLVLRKELISPLAIPLLFNFLGIELNIEFESNKKKSRVEEDKEIKAKKETLEEDDKNEETIEAEKGWNKENEAEWFNKKHEVK